MMDCIKFQETITDYLDGQLETCARAEFAAHRLRCRACREVFSDVRMTVEMLGEVAAEDVLGETTALENRILAATTAGEMLSCGDFDRLIERYFDGVILAPTFQTFQAHFKTCHKCRRLMAGIDEAIALCSEVRESDVEMPPSLHSRIMAATVGSEAQSVFARWRAAMVRFARPIWTPQWAAAALIFAAGTLFVYSRFGGFGEMASEAGTRAGRLVTESNEAVTQTGVMAFAGFQTFSRRVNNMLRDKDPRPVPASFRAPPSLPQSAEQLPLSRQPRNAEAQSVVESEQERKKHQQER
jgi:predicted anti-sigma-YlaC factor YlaD